MHLSIPIQLVNNTDIPKIREPVTFGIPIARGKVFKSEELFIEDSDASSLPCYIKPLGHWADGSLKWVLADFQADAKENETPLFHLASYKNRINKSDQSEDFGRLVVDHVENTIRINTGLAVFSISKDNLGIFEQVLINGVAQLSVQGKQIQLQDKHGDQLESVINSIDYGEEDNFIRRKVSFYGSFIDRYESVLADFDLALTFYAGKTTVKCSFCLINPHAAKHPKGVWDLGDEGSFLFQSLSVKIPLKTNSSNIQSTVQLSPKTEPRILNDAAIKLYQDSSGGENWSSLNHVNSEGQSPLSFKGYRFIVNNELEVEGDRASPFFHIDSGSTSVSVYVPDFWQNFPKCLEVDENALLIKLFPDEFSDHFELQGGEQKTHHFYLDFSHSSSALDWCMQPLEITLPVTVYTDSKAVPWLSTASTEIGIQQLIQRGIKGSHNFFEKREAIDEYGWRNYGEIYADHEQHEYKGKDQLISHYNNQYDALYGFIRQFILTGNRDWQNLYAAQAQHIIDIDIYHTDEDRDEYNGGLFWHTHHYLDAFTCTHRTFSLKHAEDFIYGEIGGGPGGEHCYTTGLSYFYFLTGEERYKQAALKLTHWMIRLYDGSGTVLERLFQFKNKDISVLRKLLSSETVQKYKYPFSRGTGNYITSLIDAYQLTGDISYISRVDEIIVETIHPNDSIALRNLHDIENCWSYLVLLQAICKYLELKVSENLIDNMFMYARDCLLHYADWIAQHESPYLERPEALEYPNHTWVAQDLRKANILYVASCYTENNRDAYLERGRYFENYVVNTLMEEDTRYYARILIILMQNDLQITELETRVLEIISNLEKQIDFGIPPIWSKSAIFSGLIKDMFKRLVSFSLANEKRWLSFRLNP